MRRATTGAMMVLLAAGCASHDGLAPPPWVSAATGAGTVILTENPDRWRHDPYELMSARIEGDTLHATVQYGGGCADHEFALLVVPIFLESYPVQMSGSLAHDAKGDPCRALVSSDLRFDLSPIKAAYRSAYGVRSDTVHLRIADWPDAVVYTF
jgi:hypothetical protein